MAEEEDQEEQQELSKQDAKGPYRYLLLIIIILLAETAGAYMVLDWAIPVPEVVEEDPILEELEEDVFVPPFFYTDLGQLVFSPLDSRGGQLVSLTIVLEVDRLVVLDEISLKHSMVWDLVLKTLETHTVEDLRDPDKELIRETIINLINEELQNGAVTGAYFTDFIMQ